MPSSSEQSGDAKLTCRRIAAHVSNAAPNQEEGVGGASFQQDLAQIDEEELHTSSKKPAKRRVSLARLSVQLTAEPSCTQA